MNGFFYIRISSQNPGNEFNQKNKNPIQASIQHLILIDREVDYITPLLTQQVYTGNVMQQGA